MITFTSSYINQLFGTRSIGLLKPTIVTSEVIEENSDVSEHPIEDGSVIADHITDQPISVTINCAWAEEWSNGFSVKAMYSQILALRDSREPFTVKLGKRVIDNMVFTSITNNTDADSEFVLNLAISLRQVKIVSVKKVEIQTNSSTTQKTGKKTASPVSDKSNTKTNVESASAANSPQKESTLYSLVN